MAHRGRLKRRAGTDVSDLLRALKSAPLESRRKIFGVITRPVARATRRDVASQAVSLEEVRPNAARTGFRDLEEAVLSELEPYEV